MMILPTLLSVLLSFSNAATDIESEMDTECSTQARQAPMLNYPRSEFENGFIILDVLKPLEYAKKAGKQRYICPLIYDADLAQFKSLGLEPYVPFYSFNIKNPDLALDKVEPWTKEALGRTKNLDAKNPEDALLLAKILQKYIYEGWFANDSSPGKSQYDKHFRQNSQRTWCNTPWLNVTEKGREVVHGLTKEFPISRSSVYPSIPEEIEKEELAVTWGISYFNLKVCDQYDKFFHPKSFEPVKSDSSVKDHEAAIAKMIREKKPVFEVGDGAVAFKLLFNAMPDWRNIMKGRPGHSQKGSWRTAAGNKEAYNWWTHVSHARQDDNDGNGDESLRQLMNIPLAQIDISFRDSRIDNSNPALKNWMMTTYYYDPTYTNELLASMDIPDALKHMRPIGLQFGMGEGETLIFAGSENNHRPTKAGELPYEKTRLNGPVDNPKSNCLGCHGISGINFGLPPKANGDRQFAPGLGFNSNEAYFEYLTMARGTKFTKDTPAGKIESPGGNFDFNMQLDKAMRNFNNAKQHKVVPFIPDMQEKDPVTK